MRRLLALAAVLLCAQPAHAAPFRYTDPAGDALTPVAAHDIVSVSYAVAGKGAARELVVTLALRAAPATDAASKYAVAAAADGTCDGLVLHYAPGTVDATRTEPGWATGGCARAKPTAGGVTAYRHLVKAQARGTTVVWRLRLADSGLRVGDGLTEFVAMTEAGDPVFGLVRSGELTEHFTGSSIDTAVSLGRWVVG